MPFDPAPRDTHWPTLSQGWEAALADRLPCARRPLAVTAALSSQRLRPTGRHPNHGRPVPCRTGTPATSRPSTVTGRFSVPTARNASGCAAVNVERETGSEPATFCLGGGGSAHHDAPGPWRIRGRVTARRAIRPGHPPTRLSRAAPDRRRGAPRVPGRARGSPLPAMCGPAGPGPFGDGGRGRGG